LAHHLSEDVIGHQTVVIDTSTMVEKFYGKSNNVKIYFVIPRHKN
jgi:hypothetical protein